MQAYVNVCMYVHYYYYYYYFFNTIIDKISLP